jgi:hypothetical protein
VGDSAQAEQESKSDDAQNIWQKHLKFIFIIGKDYEWRQTLYENYIV